jgi:hypothetical protein
MTISNGPFETIESAEAFLALLGEQVDQAADEVRGELAGWIDGHDERRRDAWRLVLYKITSLSSHVATSRRLLKDLRTLRDLLHRHGAAGRGVPGRSRPDARPSEKHPTNGPARGAT